MYSRLYNLRARISDAFLIHDQIGYHTVTVARCIIHSSTTSGLSVWRTFAYTSRLTHLLFTTNWTGFSTKFTPASFCSFRATSIRVTAARRPPLVARWRSLEACHLPIIGCVTAFVRGWTYHKRISCGAFPVGLSSDNVRKIRRQRFGIRPWREEGPSRRGEAR